MRHALLSQQMPFNLILLYAILVVSGLSATDTAANDIKYDQSDQPALPGSSEHSSPSRLRRLGARMKMKAVHLKNTIMTANHDATEPQWVPRSASRSDEFTDEFTRTPDMSRFSWYKPGNTVTTVSELGDPERDLDGFDELLNRPLPDDAIDPAAFDADPGAEPMNPERSQDISAREHSDDNPWADEEDDNPWAAEIRDTGVQESAPPYQDDNPWAYELKEDTVPENNLLEAQVDMSDDKTAPLFQGERSAEREPIPRKRRLVNSIKQYASRKLVFLLDKMELWDELNKLVEYAVKKTEDIKQSQIFKDRIEPSGAYKKIKESTYIQKLKSSGKLDAIRRIIHEGMQRQNLRRQAQE